jgi:undecaprenyl-diphosphatase
MNSSGNPLLRFLRWLGSHEAIVLCAAGAIAAGIWIFAAIAGEVKEGETLPFDRELLLAMRRPGDLAPKGSPQFQEMARDVTALGGIVVLSLITLTTATFLALDGKGRMAGFVCASIATGTIAAAILKDFFHRPRPDIVPHAMYAASASFPSGHSMLSAVVYLTLGALLARSHKRKLLKVYFLLLACLLTLMVGVSRVYLGVHWPTDVLAGWTAGAVWALACLVTAQWLQGRHSLEAEEEHTAPESEDY